MIPRLLEFKNTKHRESIRSVLDKVGFNEKAILELMGGHDVSSVSARDPAEQLYLTRGGSSLEVLVRLFLIGVSVERDVVSRVLRPTALESWIQAGLLVEEDDPGQLSGAVHLLPFNGLLLAFDTRASLKAGQEDFVMGLGKSSLTLANLTVRRPSRRTLDLGAGGGIQALLAAKHSQRVIATDRNPRAVQFARFNAQLNGIDHLEAREGDLFEPVAGEKFDLVVTNPPFVISPERQYIYRDSGLKGDEVCQAIVHQVPTLLEEGGYCVMLCNWAHLRGEDWQQRLENWWHGTGCDALVLRSETTSSEVYATTWIKHTELAQPHDFIHRLEQWKQYYDQQGIEQISAGVIVLRRRTITGDDNRFEGLHEDSRRGNWFEIQNTPKTMLGPCGDHVVRRFEAMDYLDSLGDDSALLNTALRINPDTRLTYQCQPASDGGWAIAELRLSRTTGFVYHDKVDTVMAEFLGHCTGDKTCGQLITEYAVKLEADPGELAKQTLPIIKQLIRRDILDAPSNDQD